MKEFLNLKSSTRAGNWNQEIKFNWPQGLSQDFKTARPTLDDFKNNPSNPFWDSIHTIHEPGSDPVLR